jgi:spermidine/putrescine transport system substrate-binding protein
MNLKLLTIIAVATCLVLSSCNWLKKSKGDNNTANATIKNLNILNWDAVMPEKTWKDFENSDSVKIAYDLFSDNATLFVKVQQSNGQYDLIFPSDYTVEAMIKRGLLEKINFDNVPNFKNIDLKFREAPCDPKNEYSIPYEFSAIGIGIDTSKIKNYKRSWQLLFDERYKGHISMLDDSRYGFVPAMKILNYSLNTVDQGELEKVKELMLKQKKLVSQYSSDLYKAALSAGDLWVVEGYTGDVLQIMKENPNIVYFIPEEGSALAVENMCIPKGSKHKYSAEKFMNYILEPKVHADITNHCFYGNPNQAAIQYIDSPILLNKSIFLDNMIFDKSEFLRDLGNNQDLYAAMWRDIKNK